MSDELLPATTGRERAYDVMAAIASIDPILGGVLGNIISGMSQERRMQRVAEVVRALNDRIEAVTEDAAGYVKSEEFEDLVMQTLKRVADEGNAAKRQLYADFLAGAVRQPMADSYVERFRYLRALDEIQPAHLELIRAIRMDPDPNTSTMMGSQMHTLEQRLPGWARDRIIDLLEQLEDLRITGAPTSLGVTMTGQGAQDIRGLMTPYGKRFVEFIESGRAAV